MPKTLRKNTRNRRSKRSRSSKRSRRRNNRKSKSLRGGMFTNFKLPEKSIEIPDISAATPVPSTISVPPATPVPSTTSVPLSVPDIPSKGVFGQLGESILKNPYTSAGVAAGLAGAAGLGYYLTQDSEGVKNAKDYIRIIRTVKEKTERLEKEIEEKKRQLGVELGVLDEEGLIYDTRWRNGFYAKVLTEVAGQTVNDTTIARGKADGGTNINSIKLYTDVLDANGHINGIRASLYNIFGPERPANILLAPQPYQAFLRVPPRQVAAVPPPMQPPVWARAGAPPPPPHFLDPPQGPTREEFQNDRVSQAVYALYKARWNAWNEFLRKNPDTPVSTNRKGDLKGGVPKPPPPKWNELATSRTAQAYQAGTAVGANASDMMDAEKRADMRDHWVYYT